MNDEKNIATWAKDIVQKIADAERLGGGFRLYHEQAAKEIADRVRQAKAVIADDMVQWHQEGAEAHQRLSMLALHAEHQAQKRTHMAAIDCIQALLKAS